MRGRKNKGPNTPAPTNQSHEEASLEPEPIRKSPLQIGDFHLTHNQYIMIMSKLPKSYSLQPLKNQNKSRKLLSELNERPNKREMKLKKQEEKCMNDRLRRESSRMTIVSNQSADLDDQPSIVTASFFETRKSQPSQENERVVSQSPDKEKQEENQAEPSILELVSDLPPQRTQDPREQSPPINEVPLNLIQQKEQKKPEQPQQREQQHKGVVRRVGLKRGRKPRPQYGNHISEPSKESTRDHEKEDDFIPKLHPALEDPQIYEKRFSIQWEILRALQRHSLIGPFLLPVDEERDRAPGYSKVVKHPMDLSTIEGKLKGQAYADTMGFHSDLEQVWKNSIIYNKPGCAMRKTTAELQRFYECLKNGRNLKHIMPKRGRRI